VHRDRALASLALIAAFERVRQAYPAVSALEHVLLVGLDHRQPAPVGIECVSLPGNSFSLATSSFRTTSHSARDATVRRFAGTGNLLSELVTDDGPMEHRVKAARRRAAGAALPAGTRMRASAGRPSVGRRAEARHWCRARITTEVMMSAFTEKEIEYLRGQLLGQMATAGGGVPHIAPVGFRLDPRAETIEIGGHGLS
jgi:hypothetical protein